MSGDRHLVREAIAAYFGGTRETTDAGEYYQGGPLAAAGLSTAWPFPPKAPIANQLFTSGAPAGFGWGAVLLVQLPGQVIRRRPEGGMGGPTSGWRGRIYTVTCELLVISYEPHAETAEAGLDDLLDAMSGLIYADRTLGTTSAVLYPLTGRLITEAGEGAEGIRVTAEPFEPATDSNGEPDKRGKYLGYATYTFEALTMVAA
jgi:hypothetical protein